MEQPEWASKEVSAEKSGVSEAVVGMMMEVNVMENVEI